MASRYRRMRGSISYKQPSTKRGEAQAGTEPCPRTRASTVPVDDTNRRLEDTQSHDTENADLTAERSICTPPVGLGLPRLRGIVCREDAASGCADCAEQIAASALSRRPGRSPIGPGRWRTPHRLPRRLGS